MKIPIELQNIIYQYKMDMDFLLLKKEWKRNKELKKSYCDLTNKFSQIYLKIQKFELGDKIINSKTKRIGSVVDIYRINNNTSVVIEYDDQKDIQ